MSAESRSDRPKAEPAKRSFAGKVLVAAAFLLVFATMMGGAFACVFLMLRLGDSAPLSSLIHEDGRGGLVAGGIAMGGIPGLFLPLLLIAMVWGTGNGPRMGVGSAAKQVLGLILFDVYVFVLAVVVSLLGWILPAAVINLVAVCVIGFSWFPLMLFPWEKVGLVGVVKRRPSVSLQKD